MARPPQAPHPDSLRIAIRHFNASFRHRYRLPSATVADIRRIAGFNDEWGRLDEVRLDGVADASCAVIARGLLSAAPRYAIGLITGDGSVHVLAPDEGDPSSYRSGHVLLVNPLGGSDNWRAASSWLRRYASVQARRRLLAGLASEERPDEAQVGELLRAAATTHGRAVALPPDEAFSTTLAAEVGYIYDVPPATLRAWKRRYRAGLAAGKVGAPRKNR